ncbi:MAG: putative toxin-antitoxin system toxin component, PIN family [Candidatus Thermoplasmatota archaeon]|nr:putative toxin-antitoxin system toxin component, PIN family [Candidatus Thermoplasmatota archaeon]
MRLVLDSNVLISALFWNGNERVLLEECKCSDHTSVTSEPIIREVENVLREKFKVPDDRLKAFTQSMIMMSDLVFISGFLKVVDDDPKDNMVLETAIVGKADFVITGDNHLLKIKQYGGVKILKASKFLSRRWTPSTSFG